MKENKPKGILIPIGGGEDKKDRKEVLTRVISESCKENPLVCLITLATSLPKEVANDYKEAFNGINHSKISFIHFNVRSEADNPKHLKTLSQCDIVLFSGGDQLKLSSLLGGTKSIAIIKERYFKEKNFVVAGTSAGATAMSDTMITSGSSSDAMIKGELELTNGLDFINSVFIDTHFTQRGRFGRIIQTVISNPGVIGLGVGEDTAIVIKNGDEFEVVGSGLVVVVDGTGIEYSDLTERSNGEIVSVEGIKMHILGPGKRFLLKEKKFHPDDKITKNEK